MGLEKKQNLSFVLIFLLVGFFAVSYASVPRKLNPHQRFNVLKPFGKFLSKLSPKVSTFKPSPEGWNPPFDTPKPVQVKRPRPPTREFDLPPNVTPSPPGFYEPWPPLGAPEPSQF
ncbi:unnamed protein product [Arabidopsis lyrata]|uniref:Transmembrane protein n=1 Tax=Arabidopsis lyrata subsp. lyrata TaxID=81972 RepID=D7MAX2_ARALL|nr:hypothetical protein ARALYDRAFT_915307 [Arabidopsis lyrata subsp. lyrata]CAH8276598.1 unnamed protein product [Arabidopsis lyrata]